MAEETTQDTETAEATEAETETQEVQNVEDLPEWAQKAIEKANKEAAKYRVRARDAADEVTKTLEAKHREEVESLREKYEGALFESESTKLRLTRQSVALEMGVPADKVAQFAERLRGESEEELRADAKELYSVMGLDDTRKTGKSRLTDPSQSAGHLALNGDPLLESVRRVLGKH